MAALLPLEASNEAATVRGEAVEALTQAAEGQATRIATPTSPHRDSKGTETPEVAARAMGEADMTATRTMDVEVAATRPTKGDSRAPTAPRGPILVSTHLFNSYAYFRQRTSTSVCDWEWFLSSVHKF